MELVYLAPSRVLEREDVVCALLCIVLEDGSVPVCGLHNIPEGLE